ncbi:hypothetical protein, conserved [Eimeria necatrix]|uniref:mRNA 5'-phosphatase n=1 Tax=Eimeria necatrix TaxID=51315 RepID=U6MS87_9EIME|nr:hypothetical protein, conserved [Eimeria necatrix]CDJ65344.1 hypothetical protein, conserved [Eimeria necatrix]
MFIRGPTKMTLLLPRRTWGPPGGPPRRPPAGAAWTTGWPSTSSTKWTSRTSSGPSRRPRGAPGGPRGPPRGTRGPRPPAPQTQTAPKPRPPQRAARGLDLRRRRLRQSLVHRSGLRVDLTKVQQQTKPSWGAPPEARGGPPARWAHEVELELHPSQIARAVLHLQQTGDPRPLWCLCCTFLSLLRELAAALNSPLGPRGPRGPRGPWDDLEEVQMAAAEEVAFKHYLSEELPLIGDYAYRAVVQQMLQQQQRSSSSSSSAAAAVPSLQDFLKQPEAESRCLYTQNKTHISGPWIPHKDADGRVHLIELKR